MLLRDAAAVRDVTHETLVLETVPPGINIFSLLNLPVPGNVTDFEGWKVIFSSNSTSYGNISSVLQVSESTSQFYKKIVFSFLCKYNKILRNYGTVLRKSRKILRKYGKILRKYGNTKVL